MTQSAKTVGGRSGGLSPYHIILTASRSAPPRPNSAPSEPICDKDDSFTGKTFPPAILECGEAGPHPAAWMTANSTNRCRTNINPIAWTR
jgi:hypothetical protein